MSVMADTFAVIVRHALALLATRPSAAENAKYLSTGKFTRMFCGQARSMEAPIGT